uniref:C2H2-type domain-containing protein n=1 Tax=Timema monikensis TaxID=170555 RepID=A0A7R9EJ94_9NEOP|nr:unnamed protein product [Timema monikensis]
MRPPKWMAPSSVELSHKLSCCICDENLETIGTLHYHQMFSHTTEELSLAVLSLKGLGLVLEESTEVESLLLRNSLAKYPHFILGQDKARNSDSESTMTAESSSTPPSSIEHTNNEKVNINNRVIPIKSTSHNIKTSKISVALRIQKLKEKLDKKKGERSKGPIPKSANIKTLSKNHTNMCEKTPEHQGNSLTTQSRSQVLSDKTSNDSNKHKNLKFKSKKDMKDFKIQPLVNGGSEQVKADKGNTIKSCTNLSPDKIKLKIKNGKKSIKRTLNNNNSFETKNRKLVRNNLGIRPLVQNSLQMECYNDSESSDLESGPSCSNEGNGSQSEISNLFTPNSTTSLLSPDNSPHPERHIQAIITRLPNVILPQDDSKLGRHSKRKKQQTPRRLVNNDYLLPSPVAWHHQPTVRYNYGVKREPQSDEERNEQEVMQDYFIPRIEMKGVGETLDIGCGTTALDLTEKEVQTVNSITPSSEKAVQSDIPMTNGNGNLQTQNKSKSPKFGDWSVRKSPEWARALQREVGEQEVPLLEEYPEASEISFSAAKGLMVGRLSVFGLSLS